MDAPHEEGRRPGLEPPRPQAALLQRRKQAVGVVDAAAHALGPLPRPVGVEAIAVVAGAQSVEGAAHVHGPPCAQGLNLRMERPLELGLRDPADARVVLRERDVSQLVEVTEDRYLGELGHAGDEDKAEVLVRVLQD